MKTLKLFLIVSLLFVAGITKAQDVIVKKDSSTILSKVTKIGETEIEYKKWSNLDGPTYVIRISDVASINYQNGEVEHFSTKTETPANKESSVTTQEVRIVNQEVAVPTIGIMERSGKHLTLDGRTLSDDEVFELVGYENYQTYHEAKRQMAIGRTFTLIPLVTLGIYVTAIAITYYTIREQFADDVAIYGAIPVILVGTVSIPFIVFNRPFGKNRLNWVADEYNRKAHGYSYSYNLSPSIMKCKTPQLQNTYGLGLTFNMNF